MRDAPTDRRNKFLKHGLLFSISLCIQWQRSPWWRVTVRWFMVR